MNQNCRIIEFAAGTAFFTLCFVRLYPSASSGRLFIGFFQFCNFLVSGCGFFTQVGVDNQWLCAQFASGCCWLSGLWWLSELRFLGFIGFWDLWFTG
jgi:hypothetical protein